MLPAFLLVLTALPFSHGYWAKVWEDEFNGGNLKDKWNFEVNCDGGGNNELQCYTDNRWENVRQENGQLIIQARREDWQNKKFTSTRMTTKANWLHGKFEMRAKLPRGKHLWPAFWMMPANSEYGTWPRSGEIDIMEYRGQRPTETQGTLHFGNNWTGAGKGQVGSGERQFPFDFSRDFHVFGLDWSPEKIQWIVDGRVYHEEPLRKLFRPGDYNQQGQPFDKNFFIIINLAVGGGFFGNEPFDPNEAYAWEKNTMEIDWIRKWEWR